MASTEEIFMSAMTIEAAAAPANIGKRDATGLRRDLHATGRAARLAFQPILRIIAKALMQYRIRCAIGELSQLDDRMLKDIGLNRSGLEDAVRTNRGNGLAAFGPEWAWLTGKEMRHGGDQ